MDIFGFADAVDISMKEIFKVDQVEKVLSPTNRCNCGICDLFTP